MVVTYYNAIAHIHTHTHTHTDKFKIFKIFKFVINSKGKGKGGMIRIIKIKSKLISNLILNQLEPDMY